MHIQTKYKSLIFLVSSSQGPHIQPVKAINIVQYLPSLTA